MRRAFFPLVLLLAQFAVFTHAHAAGNVVYTKQVVRNVPVNVVTANLNSPNVTVSPALARNGVGSSEGFGSMLSRLQPSAAITGTYFCTKSLLPVGDIVVNSQLTHFGPVGTGVCFTPDNQVEFRPTKYARSMDWSGYSSVICTGPRLVNNGVAYVYMGMEGFQDRSIYRQTQRSALGVTKHNKLLLVTVNRPILLSHLANIMRDLGAVNAVTLDGGTSTALYCNGNVYSHPGRKLTNLLVVYESPSKFARIKPHLAPSPIATSQGSRS